MERWYLRATAGVVTTRVQSFGPSFEEIATKRSREEIRAMVSDPEGVSKVFGYKRNAMPKLNISDENLTAITEYILSFRPKGKK